MSTASSVKVPSNDALAEYLAFREAIDAGIQRVIAEGQFTLGREVGALEREVAAMLGAGHAVAVASGTASLHLTLRALGVGPGDEVLTVANTDAPTVSTALLVGASVRWVDIHPIRLTMDAASLTAAITPRSRVVIPVHLHGLPADLTPILDVARRHGLLVVEDAALAFGTRYGGKPVGTFGDAGCFSFSPSKIVTAFGDAGMVLTADAGVAERVRSLRSYGQGPATQQRSRTDPTPAPWEIAEVGLNERMDEIQAVVVRAKLAHFEELRSARQRVAARYRSGLAGLSVTVPEPPPGADVVYRTFPILVEDRDRIQRALVGRGIAARTYYGPPLHVQPAFKALGSGPGDLPGTEAVARRLLCLPVYPQMTDAQIDFVLESLRAAIGG
ncbi:MAG: DegT/DnrJ/EryC1/StrS family aminotransferase [Chloroflexi bacterium]|nr:DegT/DnrJ/EryC1/StrS family aminotransferase [Chloroflexota bacterium]